MAAVASAGAAVPGAAVGGGATTGPSAGYEVGGCWWVIMVTRGLN